MEHDVQVINHKPKPTFSLLMRSSCDLARSLYFCSGGVLGMAASARILTKRAKMVSNVGLRMAAQKDSCQASN